MLLKEGENKAPTGHYDSLVPEVAVDDEGGEGKKERVTNDSFFAGGGQ